MNTYKKNMLYIIISLLAALLPGCSIPKGPMEVVFFSKPGDDQKSSSVAKRFQEPTAANITAVESAIELSEKYAKLSEQTAVLRNKNEVLTAENDYLSEQLTGTKNKLKQTQKELTEANDLLVEMRIEINNWKTSILGFRDEIRQAEKAQIEALLKILETLGAEINIDASQEGVAEITTNPSNYR